MQEHIYSHETDTLFLNRIHLNTAGKGAANIHDQKILDDCFSLNSTSFLMLYRYRRYMLYVVSYTLTQSPELIVIF